MVYTIDHTAQETKWFNDHADFGTNTPGSNDPVIGGVDRLASLLGGFDVQPSVPTQSLGAYAYPDAAAYQQSLGGVPAGYWGGAQQPQQPVAAAQPSVVMPQNMYDYQAPAATTTDVGGVNMSALDAFKNLGFNVEKPEGPAQQTPQRPKGNDFS